MAVVEITSSNRNFIHDIADIYGDAFVKKTHPTVMKWPLVSQELVCFCIMLIYIIFVNFLGPAIMKYRKPYDLRWLMIPYNIILVIFNFYIFFEFAKIRWFNTEEITCDTVYKTFGPELDPAKYRLAEITWYFYISKYVELLDTVFFVFRKKEHQLSRLHIIHHTTIPITIFYLLRTEPGGYNTFFPLANAFVHVIMYIYYGISALGDEVTIHLKFKKYVTMIQMIQFIIVLYYFLSRPFYGCNWDWVSGVANLFIAGFFFVLFCNFYWHEYLKNKQNNLEIERNIKVKHN